MLFPVVRGHLTGTQQIACALPTRLGCARIGPLTPEVLRGKDERNGSKRGVGRTIESGQEPEREIPVNKS